MPLGRSLLILRTATYARELFGGPTVSYPVYDTATNKERVSRIVRCLHSVSSTISISISTSDTATAPSFVRCVIDRVSPFTNWHLEFKSSQVKSSQVKSSQVKAILIP